MTFAGSWTIAKYPTTLIFSDSNVRNIQGDLHSEFSMDRRGRDRIILLEKSDEAQLSQSEGYISC